MLVFRLVVDERICISGIRGNEQFIIAGGHNLVWKIQIIMVRWLLGGKGESMRVLRGKSMNSSTDAQSLNQIRMAVEPYEVRESDALRWIPRKEP